MNETKFSLSGSFKKTREYIDTQLELLKLQSLERISGIIGALIVIVGKFILVLVILFFLAMALGFYLGELLASNALGFLAAGGIFLFVFLIVLAAGAKIETKLMNIAVRKLYKKMNDGAKDVEEDLSGSAEAGSTTLDQEENERKD